MEVKQTFQALKNKLTSKEMTESKIVHNHWLDFLLDSHLQSATTCLLATMMGK